MSDKHIPSSLYKLRERFLWPAERVTASDVVNCFGQSGRRPSAESADGHDASKKTRRHARACCTLLHSLRYEDTPPKGPHFESRICMYDKQKIVISHRNASP